MVIVGWFGFGGNAWLADQYRDELESLGIKLKTCSEYPNADVFYSRHTIKKFIDSCDILIFPTREVQPAKSANRLVLAMSRGKACVVGKMDAFLRVGKDGEHFVVADKENFLQKIVELAQNKGERERLGKNAFDHVMMREGGYHPLNMARKLMDQINKATSVPHVHVIIPHYLPRTDYLTLAAMSALESKGVRVTVSICSSSSVKPSLEHRDVKVYHQQERMTFSQANNYALRHHIPESADYVLLLNDDAFVSQWSISRMVEVAKLHNNDIVLNPLSNCDRGWLHNLPLEINGKQLVPAMKFEDFNDGEIAILLKSQFSDSKEFIESPFAAFYSTLIPRKVLTAVGNLEEDFKNGGEDASYCYRAKALGFKVGWTPCAFVFHFGGKSRKESHETRKEEHEADDKYTNERLAKKWPKDKKRIGIYTRGWENWDLDAAYTTGIGGSEQVESWIARKFAEDGHYVIMYGDHPVKDQYNVELRRWEDFRPEEEYFDLFISSRLAYPIENVRAKKKIVHIHDIFCLDKENVKRLYDKVDNFICLSPWHVNYFSDFHGIPKDKIIIIPNGLDHERLTFDESQKVFGRLHYSSSPDRGLDNILYMLPWIKDEVPEIHLEVFYGFHTWLSMLKGRGDEESLRKIEEIQSAIENCKEYVNFRDRVNLPQLHDAWNKAYCWLMPENFTETYCITAKEAQYSGTPIICSNVAALETTVGEFGKRVLHHPYSREARIEFIDEVVKLHKDKDYWYERAQQSLRGARECDWDFVYNNYWKKFI